MRDLLLERIQPLTVQLANELADLVVTRIEGEIGKLEDAFRVALSAFESNGEPAIAAEVAVPKKKAKAKVRKARRPAPTAAQPEAVVRPAAVPPELNASTDRLTSKGSERTRPPRSCTKCGELGRRSDTCGITHNIGASKPAADPSRLASIAAVAKKRPDSSRPQAVESDEDDDERWPASRIKDETRRAESRKREGSLPGPRSSFTIDRGEVEELNFG